MAESVTVTAQGGTVRLVMAARTASHLGALQKGLKSLAERLGMASRSTIRHTPAKPGQGSPN
jgi:hypothetical protein